MYVFIDRQRPAIVEGSVIRSPRSPFEKRSHRDAGIGDATPLFPDSSQRMIFIYLEDDI
ncbi:MAG: hypothetical protein WA996_09350 [Candidatus Promineifilaceae bacterium]